MFWSGIKNLISTWLAPLESWARGAEGCTQTTAWWTLAIPGAWKQPYIWTSHQTAIISLNFPIIWRGGKGFCYLTSIYMKELEREQEATFCWVKTSQPIANKASTKAFSVLDSRINYSMLLLPQTCSEIWDWICLSMPAIDLTIQKSKHWLKAFLSHSAMHFRGSFVPGLLLSRVTDGLLRKLPIFWAH